MERIVVPAAATPSLSGNLSSMNTETPYETECPVCRGARVVHPLAAGKPDWRRIVPCRCSVQEMTTHSVEQMMVACKLPKNSERFTFDNYETDLPVLAEALDASLQVSEETGRVMWLALTGPADMGKTHLAVAICRRWLERGKPARFCVGSLLLKELRDGFELDGELSYRQRFDFLCRVPLLVIDDLGMENPTPWAREQMQTLVDFRYFNHLPLVITTNKKIGNLGMIDPEHRISSRLQREAWCQVVAMEGLEYRLRKKKGGKVQ
ncbi:MAG: ATP-binding protein [Dehalococcoidales bacterium]|nr:ATP-binding protein [Dehalococcoidales bacterium]